MATRFQIQEIDLAKRYGLLVTDRVGTQVLFDLSEMDRQLKRLDTYLQYTDQHGQRIQTINLLVQKNVPVTYMAEATPADKSMDAFISAPASSPAAVATAKPATNPPKDNSADKEKKSADSKKAEPEKKHATPKPAAEPARRDHGGPQPFLRPPTRVTPNGIQ